MEASALHAPAGLSRLSIGGPLLRLRSDEQLVALFRAGSDDAFSLLVTRYQQRLFAYTRQMMGGSRQDAEDVLQDVFVRAYGALRSDDREVNVRAWLYRVAHNRCIDQLRRPTPPASEIFDMSRKPLHDPVEQAQRREDLRRLVEDVGRLPEQQRSALLMREIDGMSYADLAEALGTSVPAVKSLLVRARVGLAEAIEARDMDCSIIRIDLTEAYDRGVKASGRARRHMRECHSCREFRTTLRGLKRSFAALSPLGAGPLAVLAHAFGIGGAGGGGAAACKVAAVVCTAALATGGAVEVSHLADDRGSDRTTAAATTGAGGSSGATRASESTAAAAAAAPMVRAPSAQRARAKALAHPVTTPAERRRALRRREAAALTGDRPAFDDPSVPSAGLPAAAAPVAGGLTPGGSITEGAGSEFTGGASAPAEEEAAIPPPDGLAPTDPATPPPAGPVASTPPVIVAPGTIGGAHGRPADATQPPSEH